MSGKYMRPNFKIMLKYIIKKTVEIANDVKINKSYGVNLSQEDHP